MAGLFVAEDVSAINPSPPGWIWLKPIEGAVEVYENLLGVWNLKFTIPLSTHTHAELADLNITGVLSAGGDAGLTGQRTIGGYTLTFKKGILTGFSQE